MFYEIDSFQKNRKFLSQKEFLLPWENLSMLKTAFNKAFEWQQLRRSPQK